MLPEKVRDLDFVEAAQLRTQGTGSAPDCDGAQVDFYLQDENIVNKPYLISGEAFDPSYLKSCRFGTSCPLAASII